LKEEELQKSKLDLTPATDELQLDKSKTLPIGE
jgi:hypothetical protein